MFRKLDFMQSQNMVIGGFTGLLNLDDDSLMTHEISMYILLLEIIKFSSHIND